MKCVKCGTELNSHMVRDDGALECPYCGAVYRRKSSSIASGSSSGDSARANIAKTPAGKTTDDTNIPKKFDEIHRAAETSVSYGRKKRIVPTLLLVVVLFLGLGTGVYFILNQVNRKVQADPTVSSTSTPVAVIASTDNNVLPTENTSTVPSGVEWTEVSYTTVDGDGYTYEIIYKISPWILLSNVDTVNSVWAEISGGKPLPSFEDWGLEQYNNGYWRPNNIPDHSMSGSKGYMYCEGMNDMYYCMGTLTIRNLTEGWSISADNKRSPDTRLWWRYDKTEGIEGAQAIGHLFLSNKTDEEADGVLVFAGMNSDQWGPCPFILMSPEAFTPNYPDGRFYEHLFSGSFSAGDHQRKAGIEYQENTGIRVGIIGKNGTFKEP